MDKPFHHIDKHIAAAASNHAETFQCFNGANLYAPWVHGFRATFFVVLPPMTSTWSTDDVCTSICQAHRIVKADGLRLPDGSGWTIGLQLISDDATENSRVVFGSVSKIVADEQSKHDLSGKVVTMQVNPTKLKVFDAKDE